ncbi:hypothetical protein D9757_003787 [Collybiopsis confluens]|uniref:Uncharacterized protein n=1 Tax=Collybiopsis confluens TaxID=2823264 RepID=A0A8H5HVE7_9AGAR|nr:hypothetical protein D9757_003787 [Collybiopsis confluens]
MWTFVQTLALFLFVPETYIPTLRKQKAIRLRKATGDNNYFAPLEKEDLNLGHAILVSCYKPFQLVLYDRMALLLNTWTSLILGILYLAFQAYPFIFGINHGFNTQDTGLAFLGIGLGMILALMTQPFWNRLYAREAERHGGVLPPESRLYMGEVGGVLTPLGMVSTSSHLPPTPQYPGSSLSSPPFSSAQAPTLSSPASLHISLRPTDL